MRDSRGPFFGKSHAESHPEFHAGFRKRGRSKVLREIIAGFIGVLDEISFRELHRAQNKFFAHMLYMK